MEFFNKKEEVLEIKLTPFGRYKLSRGLLKPTHYAFFDEGVLYNSALTAGGVTTENPNHTVEKQNQIEGRIQEDTPSIKPFNVSTGIQTAQSTNADFIRSIFLTNGSDLLDDPLFMDPGGIYNREELQYAADRAAFMARPLGKSRLNTDKYPAWSLSMLQGEISSSARTVVSDGVGEEKIPQLNIQVKYNTYVEEAPGITTNTNSSISGVSLISDQIESIFTQPGTTNNVQSLTTELIGDKYIVVEKDDLVIELTEYNTDFYKENFEIEVFLTGSQYLGGLKQLKFNNDRGATYTSEDVQYYLNLRVDNEIERSLMQKVGINDPITLGQVTGSGAVSTRDYFIKDIYKPEEDLCD
tara:strand:+ start:3409 stop:4473 length:1065 start_codon:yes stop_codon:yes gene_type:complete